MLILKDIFGYPFFSLKSEKKGVQTIVYMLYYIYQNNLNTRKNTMKEIMSEKQITIVLSVLDGMYEDWMDEGIFVGSIEQFYGIVAEDALELLNEMDTDWFIDEIVNRAELSHEQTLAFFNNMFNRYA